MPEHAEITTDDLKERLRDCLCASQQFAPYLLPALFEKLQAVAISVKKDVLMTLVSCCKTYTPNTMNIYAKQIWDDLLAELYQTEDASLQGYIFEALTAVSSCLSRDSRVGAAQGPFSKWLERCLMHMKDQLHHSAQNTAMLAQRIMGSIIDATSSAQALMVQALLPVVVARSQETHSHSESVYLNDVLLQLLLRLARKDGAKHWIRDENTEQLFGIYKADVMKLIVRDIACPSGPQTDRNYLILDCVPPLVQSALITEDDEVRLVT